MVVTGFIWTIARIVRSGSLASQRRPQRKRTHLLCRSAWRVLCRSAWRAAGPVESSAPVRSPPRADARPLERGSPETNPRMSSR